MATEENIVNDEEVLEVHMLPFTKKVEVESIAKLISGLTGKFEIGSIYNFTYQHKTVAIADSTKAGKIEIKITPSKWAVKVSEGLWEYELDESVTSDPTTVDVLTEGWNAVLLTDAEEEEVDTEESPIEIHPAELELEEDQF